MDLEANVKDIKSLQWLAISCANILEALLLEENAQAEDITAREGHWVSRQYAEFNLWCVKVGVHGQGLKSIDIRLKDVPETCAVIRDLLTSLQIDLKKAQQPIDDNQHLKKTDMETTDSDAASDGSSLSFDSLSSLSGTGVRKSDEDVTLEETPAPSLRKHVEDTIDRLHGHALQIDKAGAKHRQQRVKIYVEKDGPKFAYQGYKEIAHRKSKVQFPLASDILHHRMAESFARRRIRFDYLREHQKKRAIELPQQRTKPPISLPAKSAYSGDFVKLPTTEEKEPRRTVTRSLEQRLKDQQTIYSATERTKLEKPVERRQERAESVVSITLRHPDFPPPPKITGHSFQCPYCRLDFRASEAGKARWSQHVIQDFEPYFCPVEQCTKPFDLPNHFDGLLHHLQDHVKERFHIDLPGGKHHELEEEEFEDYIAQQGHISDENLAVMKRASHRKGAFLFHDCPFCGGYPDVLEKRFPVPSDPEAQVELRRHIKQHMQDIALFLPPYREDIFDDDGDLQSSVFSRERGGNGSLENSDDFLTLCDRDTCDCRYQSKSATEVAGGPQIPESASTWVELFPGFPPFDKSDLTQEYCVQDDILYQLLKFKLQALPEISSEDSNATSSPEQMISETFPQTRRGEKRSTILESLALDDYEILQREYSRLRCPGTYRWLLHTDAFHTWLSKPSQTFSCYGFPGSGKTILTSVVVDHVIDYSDHDATTGIAFAYCDQDKTEPGAGDDAYYLLLNILKQLAEHLPSKIPALEFLYNTQDVSSVPGSISEVCRTIERVAEGYSKIFLIVDAIDEIQEGSRGRMEFLSEMAKLQKACSLNLFLTSRPIVDITQKFFFPTSLPIQDISKRVLSMTSSKINVPREFGGSIQMDFCATDQDIRQFFQSRLTNLPFDMNLDHELLKNFENRIIRRANGMILLAREFLDELEQLAYAKHAEWMKNKIQEILDTYPNYSDHCRGLLRKVSQRIESRDGYWRHLAMRAMGLVFSSRRQLKATELQHALSASFMKPLDENRPDINDILLACAGLLEIDDWSNTMDFSHPITMDFFREISSDSWLPGLKDLATVCIECVSSEVFDAGPCSTDVDFRERLRSYPFYSYAASNWGHHAGRGLISTSILVDFLSAKSAAQAAGQALMMSQLSSQQANHYQNIPNNISGLHLAAYFGLEEATRFLLQNSIPDPRDSHYRTPLMYALEQDQQSVYRLLIDHGADVNARDIQGRTPLHLAAIRSSYEMVSLLVRSGADVNVIDNWHMSPLHTAAGDTNSSTASQLLRLGAKVNGEDYMGWTPLLRATICGCSKTVELLFRNGASIEDADESSVCVLAIAAMIGEESIVSTILQYGADVDTRDKQAWTPLLHATANGHGEAVRELLAWGADIQATEEDGWDPLLIATSMGHEAIVELLLHYGADIKSTVNGGYSPLLTAACRGYDSIVALLCQFLSPEDREAREQFGQTPLLVATRHGHEAIVEQLLEYDVDTEAKEYNFGQTPLLMAVRLGHIGIVGLLLFHGADIEATRFDGKNAIEIASAPERKEILDELLAHKSFISL